MPRQARVVVPGVPYHVTHRGNCKQDIFFRNEDREKYLDWLFESSQRCGLEIWGYCLMTNHVHHILLPHEIDSLARVFGRTHGRFAQRQNLEYGGTGHLWENRFFSTPLDEEHLWAAIRYVELNPVRAGLVKRAEEHPWSSARAHATGAFDPLLSPSRPFPGGIKDWSEWLAEGLPKKTIQLLRDNTSSGRPTGSKLFVREIETKLERSFARKKPGRPASNRK